MERGRAGQVILAWPGECGTAVVRCPRPRERHKSHRARELPRHCRRPGRGGSSIEEAPCAANLQFGGQVQINATFFNAGSGVPSDDVEASFAFSRASSDPKGRSSYGRKSSRASTISVSCRSATSLPGLRSLQQSRRRNERYNSREDADHPALPFLRQHSGNESCKRSCRGQLSGELYEPSSVGLHRSDLTFGLRNETLLRSGTNTDESAVIINQ